ncbi:MOSC domain-containing protein [Thalassomonas sp. M1454]|uniref:MOSC domain-containing protein n=1 Tax=Thalassomonas sp. M1454 TaxID=2594477 RepID=UPI00117F3A68|nr:MOSC N-terminal beta barrel domain-containing protein [Thalassomonas sp. M1454]TRX53135.1 MOSC domain-containing protein [Thalassomonas sp. M1454]
MAHISALSIYPIKSTSGIQLSTSMVKERGLEFDRSFVITDLQGKFITGRTKAKLVLVNLQRIANGYLVTAPKMDDLVINFADFSKQHHSVQVWNDSILAQHCSVNIDEWFSKYLNTQCQLHYFGNEAQRYISGFEQQVSFADGYPILLISQASLDDLNSKSTSHTEMAQFRPNIVIQDCSAFAEDNWSKIKIGEVEFILPKHCSRCIFTTVDAHNGKRHANKEPLATLEKYRLADDGEIYFGQNLIPLNHGKIQIGDKVEVLESNNSISFIALK